MLSMTVAPTAIPASSPTCSMRIRDERVVSTWLRLNCGKARAKTTYRKGVSCNSGDNEEKIKSDKELKCKSLSMVDGGDSDATRHEGMEDSLESERSTNGGRNLSCDVGWNLSPWEVTTGSKCNGEGRVKMSPRDVSS